MLNFVYKVYHSGGSRNIWWWRCRASVSFGQRVGFGGLPPENFLTHIGSNIDFAINPAIGSRNRPSSCRLRTEYMMYTVNAR